MVQCRVMSSTAPLAPSMVTCKSIEQVSLKFCQRRVWIFPPKRGALDLDTELHGVNGFTNLHRRGRYCAL